jgi:signal peptide peptidase SppA
MRLIDIINAPWAITPEMLDEIQAIYGRHLRGEKIDLVGLEERLGQPLNNEPKGYEVHNGVALLPIEGVIAQRMNLFSRISGGTSSQAIMKHLHTALADRSVEAIIGAFDTPGGTVAGTPELAQAFFEARAVKPLLGFTDGQMCSAGYWIGAACDLINISSNVTSVGSIGVIGKHVDTSRADEMAGRKTTLIVAGKYKAAGHPHGPLSAEDAAVLQGSVDHAYSVFVEDIARFRDAALEDVLTRMADGRVFHGRQAIDAGLVDGVSTLAETMDMARDMARTKKKTSRAGVALAPTQTKEHAMNLEQLKAEHPELVQAIVAEAQAGMNEAVATARAEGAEAERLRIADVRAQAIPGHEALIEQLAFDGKSTSADAALAIVGAEKSLRSKALLDIDDEAPPAVPHATAGEGDGKKTMKRKDFDTLDQTGRRAFLADGGKIVS